MCTVCSTRSVSLYVCNDVRRNCPFFVRSYEFHQNSPMSLFMKSRTVLDFSCVKTVGALPAAFTHLDIASLSTAVSASSSLGLFFHCASLCRRSPTEGTLTPASLCHIFPLLLGSTWRTSLDRNHRVSSGNATDATASEPSSGTSSAAAVPLLLPCAGFKRRKPTVNVTIATSSSFTLLIYQIMAAAKQRCSAHFSPSAGCTQSYTNKHV